MVAGLATRAVLIRAWRATRHEDPPGNPAAQDTAWSSAIVWALASGTALAMARLLAQRSAAATWKSVTGEYPEGLEELRP
jgi:hypothetical protein